MKWGVYLADLWAWFIQAEAGGVWGLETQQTLSEGSGQGDGGRAGRGRESSGEVSLHPGDGCFG